MSIGDKIVKASDDGLAFGADTIRIALKAAKYGMHVSLETSKFIGDNAENMADYFSDCKLDTGMRRKVEEKAEWIIDDGFNLAAASLGRLRDHWD